MSDRFQPSVFSRHAQMHLGPGDQYNYYLGETSEDGGGKSFESFAADYLRWLRRNFVPPVGFGEAWETLTSQGTVLLDGAPGSGRAAAAQMLLHRLCAGEETFRGMPLNDGENGPLLACDGIADGDLLLLDLSEVEPGDWTRAHRELRSARAQVHKHRARLVVVLPHDRAERLEPGLGPYRVRIGRPPGSEVLRRYLRFRGLPWDELRRPSPVAAQFLGEEPPMREIAHFAELVVEARGKGEGPGDFAAWCEKAYTALCGREKQVASDLETPSQGRQRALLLAAAMLHGAHADTVHAAATSLLTEVKHPGEAVPVLEEADLLQRFREIGAERDAEGRVRFRDLGYDSAVRRHFWTHKPELREGLQAWVGRTVLSASLDRADRDELVGRFTDLCLHDRYREILISQVERWSAGPVSGAGVRAAVRALAKGLGDQRHGWFFRRRIYDWSTRPGLSDALAEVIVSTCAEVMAVRHPDQAVVRLHHRARREEGTTRARDALTRLVRADMRLLRLMLDRLHRQFTGDNRYGADPDLFLALAAPDLLTTTGGRGRSLIALDVVRDQVTTGWSAVFARRPEQAWSPAAERWLLAAGEGGASHDALLDVLVEGGRERMDVLSRLYVLAGETDRSFSPRQDRDMPLRDRVLHKINIAQGVQVA